MDKHIYLFRHGETEWNVQRRIQGSTPHVPLNDVGFHQARRVAEVLVGKGIGRVYSSPLLRTRQTAAVVAEKFRVPVHYVEGLQERSFGKLEGMTFEEVDRHYPPIGALLRSQKNWDFKEAGIACGVEPVDVVQARVFAAVHALAQEAADKAIAVSTHGGAIYNFLQHIGAEGVSAPIQNGEVFCVGFGKDGFRLIGRERG